MHIAHTLARACKRPLLHCRGVLHFMATAFLYYLKKRNRFRRQAVRCSLHRWFLPLPIRRRFIPLPLTGPSPTKPTWPVVTLAWLPTGESPNRIFPSPHLHRRPNTTTFTARAAAESEAWELGHGKSNRNLEIAGVGARSPPARVSAPPLHPSPTQHPSFCPPQVPRRQALVSTRPTGCCACSSTSAAMSCCARASTNYGTVLSIERFNHNGRGSGVSPRQKIHTNGASYLTVFHGDNPGFRQAAATRSSTSHSLNNVYLSYGTQVLPRIINQNKMVNLKTRKSMLKTWMMTMRDSAMGRSNGFDMAGFQQSKPVVTMSNSNGISTMYELADAQYWIG
nr:uncharacterized protein LOC127320805 isoform X1 [Lolium perenne]